MFNNIYTKIKELFNIKIVIEPKKEIEFKSKIPEYTKWVIPKTVAIKGWIAFATVFKFKNILF